MPGQRKRKRKHAGEHARNQPTVPGRWQPIFSTQAHAELKAEITRLHETGTVTHAWELRCDMFCGRLEHPTTYQLSIFIPENTGRHQPQTAAGRREDGSA
ncbi:hypothetical protein ACFV7Q_27445 [Streptomyces sp. NPDC059851]|uniref:hypothetical protein n=1 Tax=Streptomyces sp. NPDC059851 TaxID=3346971 RepID=UPI00365A334E